MQQRSGSGSFSGRFRSVWAGALAGFLAASVLLVAQTLGDTYARRFYVDSDGTFGGAAPVIRSGTATPEGAVTGNVGDLFLRTDGGASTTLYIKESGTGNTGWQAASAGSAAPLDATYITQTANGSLSMEQALASLSSGIMRVATTTGVVTSLTDSAGIATNISDETGSGALTFATSPTLVTPTLGVASATSVSASGAMTAASLSATGVSDAATLRTTGSTDCDITSGTGSPEGVVTGDVCDLFLRTDGGTTTTLYVKESGAGNTGWVAAGAGGGGGGGSNAVGNTVYLRKTADEAVTSSTTLQDDDHLTFSADANTDYHIEVVLYADGATSGDLKWAWTVPAGATGIHGGSRQSGTATGVDSTVVTTATSTLTTERIAGLTGTGTDTTVLITAYIRIAGTAGTVTFQWAQNNTNGTATTLRQNSTLVYTAVDTLTALSAGLTASVTQTQGEGALTSKINEVATVANTNDTVTLPAALGARAVFVINNGANTLQIFPASGDNLGAGVDTATTLAAGSNVDYVAYDSTNWEVR